MSHFPPETETKEKHKRCFGHKIVKDYIIDTNSYDGRWPLGGGVELLIHTLSARRDRSKTTNLDKGSHDLHQSVLCHSARVLSAVSGGVVPLPVETREFMIKVHVHKSYRCSAVLLSPVYFQWQLSAVDESVWFDSNPRRLRKPAQWILPLV